MKNAVVLTALLAALPVDARAQRDGVDVHLGTGIEAGGFLDDGPALSPGIPMINIEAALGFPLEGPFEWVLAGFANPGVPFTLSDQKPKGPIGLLGIGGGAAAELGGWRFALLAMATGGRLYGSGSETASAPPGPAARLEIGHTWSLSDGFALGFSLHGMLAGLAPAGAFSPFASGSLGYALTFR